MRIYILSLVLLAVGSARANEYHDNVSYRCDDGTVILNCRAISGPMRGLKVSCGWPNPQGNMGDNGVMFFFGKTRAWRDARTCFAEQ